jgi:hypothetical protein
MTRPKPVIGSWMLKVGCWMFVSFSQIHPVTAQDAPKRDNADSRFSLTIYSTADPATFDPHAIAQEKVWNENYRIPGFSVVRETRRLTLEKGPNTVKFTDVAAGIDPTTVSFKSLTAPKTTTVLEQNYEYDLVSPDKLLEKYLNRSIIINRKQEPLAGDRTRMPETIEAKLLAFTRDQLVLQTNNKQLPVQIIPRSADISEIKLFDLQTGLTTRPTLVWKLDADTPGEHDVLVSYQTDNITWRADYAIVINKADTKADLSAWVTVVNESGAAYPNAKLKLVAGDVQRLRAADPRLRAGEGGGGLFGDPDTGFKEKSFFEYHLYTLGRTTSIADKSTKQIELFPPRGDVPVERTYVYAGQAAAFHAFTQNPATDRDPRIPMNTLVDVYLKMANTQKNGLGIPLPAGRIRVYKRDEADNTQGDEGSLEFIGEDKIDHTPKDEQVLIRTGSAFDIVGQRKQTEFTLDENARTMTESFEIKLRNHKDQPVRVAIKETLFRWSTWEITKASDKWSKHDARMIHIPVEVPANGEKTVTYTVKYTW